MSDWKQDQLVGQLAVNLPAQDVMRQSSWVYTEYIEEEEKKKKLQKRNRAW